VCSDDCGTVEREDRIMAEAAAAFEQRSRWLRAWDALRGRDEAIVQERDDSVSFPELVWAHHKRQEALEGAAEAAADDVYRKKLMRFKAEHGKVLETYWCRYEASGVALTEIERPRRLSNLYRRDSVLRFHAATDWRTEQANRIESALHRWETMAIRTGEILRGPSERIALHRVFAATTRLLAFADRPDPRTTAADPALASVLAEDASERRSVHAFYVQAGENSARIVYFRGMVLGTLLLGAGIGVAWLAGWAIGWLHPHRESTYTLFVTLVMGAVGAVLSVMTRMRRRDGWALEWEVGRKSVRSLGALRPWIGALFAVALYLALKSNLVNPFQDAKREDIYFYATVAFLAGFSERWAQVLFGATLAGKSPDDEDGGAPADDGRDDARRGRAAQRR
jgi:hypothetical protein